MHIGSFGTAPKEVLHDLSQSPFFHLQVETIAGPVRPGGAALKPVPFSPRV